MAMLALAVALCSVLGADGAQVQRNQQVLLLAQGPDGHPAGTHEYQAGMRLLARCLAGVPRLEVEVHSADEPWRAGPALLAKADGVVLFLSQGAQWIQADSDRLEALAQLAGRGGGLVGLHWGIGCRDARYIDEYLRLLGGCHGGPDRRFAVIPDAHVRLVQPAHPITRGIADFQVREEFYYRLKFVRPPAAVSPVLQVEIEGSPQTVAWAWERPGGGRSFGFSGGHFHSNWELIEYRRLLTQAVLWTLGRDIPPEGLDVSLGHAQAPVESRRGSP